MAKKLIIGLDEFLTHAVNRFPREVCGFLFSDKPFADDEKWFVFKVNNIAEDPENAWIPDRKDMLRVKKKAIDAGLTKIGNIHSHPIHNSNDIDDFIQPSPVDLKFARRFNDVIRGIVGVGYNKIYDILFHNKFGVRIPIYVTTKEGCD